MQKKRVPMSLDIGTLRRTAASYSPGWWASTIGACGLNCSVRNGKRWIPAAITAVVYQLRETKLQDLKRIQAQTYSSFPRKGFGILVRVG